MPFTTRDEYKGDRPEAWSSVNLCDGKNDRTVWYLRCADCKFWASSLGVAGDCHLQPKIEYTLAEHWCGQWVKVEVPDD